MIEFNAPMRPKPRAQARRNCRHSGVTMIELVVTAMLLVTVMTFVTTISYSIHLVWKDIGHHRVAAGELANQLEQLTLMPQQELRDAVASLKPSEVCGRTLRQPELVGELIEDNLGTRIVLKINWSRRHPGKPVELVGWKTQNQPPATSKSESNE